MDVNYFAEKFIKLFPEHEAEYQEHVNDYDEIFGHVFFGYVINPVLSRLLIENKSIQLIQKYISFIEDMYANGDDAVKSVVEVTILEYLGDNDIALTTAFAYFSEGLMLASKKIEAFWRRRSIRIYSKCGKMFADW